MRALDFIKRRDKINTPIGVFDKLGFVDYFFLDRLKAEFKEALTERNAEKFTSVCGEAIKLQTGIDLKEINPSHVIIIILQIFNENVLWDGIAFIKPAPAELKKEREKRGDEGEREPWSFDGRNLYQFLDLLSARYGWTIEEINKLDPSAGMILVQEIIAEQQYELERQHRYSEMAYKYDQTAKKSVFQPLPRPRWMQAETYSEVKTQQIRRDHLPFGNVIDTTGFGTHGELAKKKESE